MHVYSTAAQRQRVRGRGVLACAHLEHVVEDDVAEAFARGREDAGGLLHLVLLVARRLGILGQRHLLLLAHLVKLLLGILEFPQVSAGQQGQEEAGERKEKYFI